MHTLAVQCGEPRPSKNGVIGSISGRGQGDTLTFQCNSGFTPIGAIASVCTPIGDWLPDPSTFQCSPGNKQLNYRSTWFAFVELKIQTGLPIIFLTVTCPILQTPSNGSSNFSSDPSSIGTKVHFQCDSGLYPKGVRMATCLESGEWDTDLSQLICRETPGAWQLWLMSVQQCILMWSYTLYGTDHSR